MKSIIEQIFSYGLENPDKIALLDGKNSRTYSEILSGILNAKKILLEKYNLRENQRVILSADKQIEFVHVYFACHLLGVVVLPIAPDTNPKRYALIKSKVSPSLVVGFPDDDSVSLKEFSSCEKISAEKISFPPQNSIADIIFTTGTTGEPKGVQLSHENISAAARNINTFIKNSPDDVEMLALPVSHSFGLGRMRCALSNGQTLVMLGSFANVKRFFRFMRDFHVNGFGMVPASWALLKKFSGDEIEKFSSQLHYIEIGSAPMPLSEKENLIKLLPSTRICMHYGLTEASRSAFMEFHEDAERLNTVGKESPNMFITIRDENGAELPNNEAGEICVKGDAVTAGYIGLENEKYFWDKYFRTGDWGMKDNDGYIYLQSRKKELINVGGKKVSPVEVEEVLKDFDFIDDCACVGVHDEILGEVVKAFVITSQPEKISFENLDGLIGNKLEGFKHPAAYEIISEIPKTSSGKIQRLSLKG